MRTIPIAVVAILLSVPPLTAQNCVVTAQRFAEAVRDDEREIASALLARLAAGSQEALRRELRPAPHAKAFWINIYNASVQYQLKRDPQLFLDRTAFFSRKSIHVAGHHLSLDDIEHGILRRSTNKYSFGYLASFFVSDFESEFRVDALDYRVHFALNCGARSCPPIDIYEAGRVDEQLECATRDYLLKNVRYDAGQNRVWLPALCSWYRGDFGGEDGLIEMLRRYGLIPGKKPDIDYLPYDWSLHLSQYISR